MRKSSLKSFPFHLGFPGQPQPRDAAISHEHQWCAWTLQRGRLPRRRTAKVISPSPLFSFRRKEPPAPRHVPREFEKGGQGVYLQIDIGFQYIAWKCYQGALRGTNTLWLCPRKAQPHLCYRVLGITKVSRRLGGNQLPFSFTHLFEDPLLMATTINCITPYSIKWHLQSIIRRPRDLDL